MTTFLHAHSWLNWVDEDDDEDEVGLKEKPEDTRHTGDTIITQECLCVLPFCFLLIEKVALHCKTSVLPRCMQR